MAEKKVNVTVVRAFSIGNKLQEVGATVQMDEGQAKAMIDCGKAKATGNKPAPGDEQKTGDDHAK